MERFRDTFRDWFLWKRQNRLKFGMLVKGKIIFAKLIGQSDGSHVMGRLLW